MATYRQIQTNFWQDDFVIELTPEERYFYVYLMTNPKTTQCGILKAVKKLMAVELGYDVDTVNKLISKFVDYKKISYSQDTNEIMIINWIRYNFINSRNTMLCMNKELKNVKNKKFVRKFYKLCIENNYDISIVFNDIEIPVVNDEENAINKDEICNQDMNCIFDNNSETSIAEGFTNEAKADFFCASEAPCKPLGEEEIKKEIYIINKSSYKQKVINNNLEESGFTDRGREEESINTILSKFNKKIRQASIHEIKRFKQWVNSRLESMKLPIST